MENFIRVVESLTNDQWRMRGRNTPGMRINDEDEARPLGVIAHHVAVNQKVIMGRIQAVLHDEPTPPVDFKQINARHANEYADTTKAEVVSLLRNKPPDRQGPASHPRREARYRARAAVGKDDSGAAHRARAHRPHSRPPGFDRSHDRLAGDKLGGVTGPWTRDEASASGQVFEFRLWAALVEQSRGGLHVFLPLSDRGIDALVHRFADGTYLRVQAKGRTSLVDGEVHLVVWAVGLVDDDALLVGGLVVEGGLGPTMLVVSVRDFKRLAERTSADGEAIYSTGFGMRPRSNSRWLPFLVPAERLVERFGVSASSCRAPGSVGCVSSLLAQRPGISRRVGGDAVARGGLGPEPVPAVS